MLTFKNISIAAALVLASILSAVFFLNSSLIWVVLLFFIWLGFLIWGASSIQSGFFVNTIFKGSQNGKAIALTFDDGPNPETLPVLELLDKHNAKATFFCIGKQIEKYPHIFQEIIKRGHIAGNHSYSHSNNFGFFSSRRVKKELDKTDALIEKYTGKKPTYFRPPFGVTNLHIKKALNQTKHITIGWSIRSFDTAIQSEEKIFNRIKARLKPGGIILLHDTSQKTVNVLERLLTSLKGDGFDMVSMHQLLSSSANKSQ